ncbi:hypothetical protein AAHC60_09620, partial [Klebsiella quasipneumoniae subsp. similipneumoniae]
ELLLCHGTVCVVGKMRDLILQLSKSSIYSTKPEGVYLPYIMASSISTVIMPLTSEKLLVGVRASNINVDLSRFNDDASEWLC